MKQGKFLLASNSPRRREIVSWTNWDISSCSPRVAETVRAGESPRAYVLRVAREKAEKTSFSSDVHFIFAADTIVVFENEIMGKPRDAEHARRMLEKMRNRQHAVLTAIAVRNYKNRAMTADLCETPVAMRAYTDAEIAAYVDSADPLDKAGAYAIQNEGFHPVEKFHGCYASVMGLPLCHLERTLRSFDTYQHTDLSKICQNHLKYKCPITDRVMAGEQIG